jgi:hypothetical protein
LCVFFFLSLVVEVSFVIAIEVYIGSYSVKSCYMWIGNQTHRRRGLRQVQTWWLRKSSKFCWHCRSADINLVTNGHESQLISEYQF